MAGGWCKYFKWPEYEYGLRRQVGAALWFSPRLPLNLSLKTLVKGQRNRLFYTGYTTKPLCFPAEKFRVILMYSFSSTGCRRSDSQNSKNHLCFVLDKGLFINYLLITANFLGGIFCGEGHFFLGYYWREGHFFLGIYFLGKSHQTFFYFLHFGTIIIVIKYSKNVLRCLYTTIL